MAMDGKKLIEAIELADWREAGELRARSYSGRGMFGKSCVGIEIPGDVSSFRLAAAIAAAFHDLDEDEALNDVADLARLRVCEDNMGRDTIVYFPQVAWPEGEEEADGEGDDPHAVARVAAHERSPQT
jgi:hypothetical protein